VDDESGSEARPASRCDGRGGCDEAAFVACVAYRCEGDVCGTGCASNEDCAPGNLCADDRCVSGATCSDDGLELIDDSGNSIPCRPFRCEGQACLDACAATSDCAPGFACNPGNQQCEEVRDPATADDSGCGCRTAGRDDKAAFNWLSLLAVLLVLGRRRRSGRAAGVS
jgi:MYXO-CTERM domain-containing protein